MGKGIQKLISSAFLSDQKANLNENTDQKRRARKRWEVRERIKGKEKGKKARRGDRKKRTSSVSFV